MKWVEPLMKAVAKHAAFLVESRDNDFMTKVAGEMQPPKPKKEKPAEEQKDEE